MPVAHEPVELGEARARAAVGDRALVDLQQAVLELAVVRAQLAGAEELRVVGPVAVGADPDLEQRRLVGCDRPVARRGERLDPGPRPDEREAEARARPCPASPCPRRARSPARSPRPRSPSSRARSSPRTCSIAAAQISFASRIRSISCGVLIARAAFSTGVASCASGHASNHAFVNVVGSPTIRSDACVPSESSSPTRP